MRREKQPEPWGEKEVLVGTLRTKEQLDVALNCGFYHLPADLLRDAERIRYVAIYQSRRFFGIDAGIWWYGKVKTCRVLPRNRILEIPKETDIPYCRLEVERWLPLPRPILPGEQGILVTCTTKYQLFHSRQVAELLLECPEDFALFGRLRALAERKLPLWSLRQGGWRLRRRFGWILASDGQRKLRFRRSEVLQTPGAVLMKMQESGEQ